MNAIIRNTFAAVVGVVTGSVVNMALVMTGPKIIPPPAGVDMTKVESLAASVHLLEPKHFVFPFLAHALGALIGALVAYLIAARYRAIFAWGIGVLFLAGGIAASLMIPAPKWFIALDLLVAYLPMAWLAICLGRRISGSASPAKA